LIEELTERVMVAVRQNLVTAAQPAKRNEPAPESATPAVAGAKE
jgi:hypothetical protein